MLNLQTTFHSQSYLLVISVSTLWRNFIRIACSWRELKLIEGEGLCTRRNLKGDIINLF